MLTKTIPDSNKDANTGIYNVSTDLYSQNMVNLLARLLEINPEERPSVKQLLQDDYVLMSLEKLQNPIIVSKSSPLYLYDLEKQVEDLKEEIKSLIA